MSDSSLEKVLIIDDSSDYRKLIKTFINKLLPKIEVIEYDPVFEGAPGDDFDWAEIDVLLLDYHLSIVGTTGLDILHKHHKKPEFPATIMLTGAGTEETAIRALKFGIYEYLPKQSLTKDKLKQSIIHAWEEKLAERKKLQEISQHNRSFSKEVFYENLEKAFYQKDHKRVLVVIKPDNINVLEQKIGVIGRDNLVNHIGKNSFEVFKIGACNPNITRISDDEIAVQIDYPVNQETLEFNMQGLCKHLAKCTFKFSDEKFKFTVSIGVLDLSLFDIKAERLINIAQIASERVSNVQDNAYYIWKESDGIPELPEVNQKNQDKTEGAEVKDTANEEKLKLEAELKAAAEAKEQAEAKIKAEQEAKVKLEAELKAAAEAKEQAEAKIKAEQEAKLKAESEAQAKADAEIQAAKETREKLEAELKAAAEAKQQAEAKIKAEQEAKVKLEA
ncbi:MAG: response regulator, partial [Proteobacteria bacterium]|nr:response regulator [Pseudomonadota bacterium]